MLASQIKKEKGKQNAREAKRKERLHFMFLQMHKLLVEIHHKSIIKYCFHMHKKKVEE